MRILFNNLLFESPVSIVECYRLSEVVTAIAKMEKAIAEGFYLAGFLSYEAGYAFEKQLFNNKEHAFPLIYFGVYQSSSTPTFVGVPPLHKMERAGLLSLFQPSPPIESGEKGNPAKGGVDEDGAVASRDYLDSINAIKDYLAKGETYQVNYTFKINFDYHGELLALFKQLKMRQPTPYSAFIETPTFSVLSLSPELFFKKSGSKLIVKPMKGTAVNQKANLHSDPKNQAENIMIVDLLRNDLGRIAKIGTVKAAKLFEVQQYPTLCQMTSTITAEIDNELPLFDLFRNLFPSGSVTGAPKLRTMQIIRELENEDRNIYTGAIGYITPQKEMLFNVAIRTLLLKSLSLNCYKGEMGIGSGITYDSDPKKEFEECLLKARFLAGV